MQLITVELLMVVTTTWAIHCDKEMDYHDNYGYGFDIACDGISRATQKILQEISVYNEIVLKINNSNLVNVSSAILENVPKIRQLIITDSIISTSNHIFRPLLNLEYLQLEDSVLIDHNNESVVFERINGTLKDLHLINVTNINSAINSQVLTTFKSLESVTMSHGDLKTLTVPFCDLPKLRYVHLDHNAITSSDHNAFTCHNRSQKRGALINLNDHNFEINSKEVQFHDIDRRARQVKLIELDLSYNQISELHDFTYVNTLKYIDLGGNSIRTLHSDSLKMLKDLKVLNCRDNQVGEATLVNLALQVLHLEHNQLTTVTLNLTKLSYLNLSNNSLTRTLHLEGLKSLRTVFLSDNHLTSVNLSTTVDLLDLSSNKIQLDSSWNISCKNLSLRNNSIDSLPLRIFHKNLEILDLSRNRLQLINTDTFNNLINLEVLNLSHNLLESLNHNLFRPLKSLHTLDIEGNRLRSIDFGIIGTLRRVNIDNNPLSCDLVSKLIVFLSNKTIDYTGHRGRDFYIGLRTNIDGISCENEPKTGNSVRSESMSAYSWIFVFVGVIVAVALFSLGSVKMYGYYVRRRHYVVEDMELIEE